MSESELQRLERQERDGPQTTAPYTDEQRKRLAGAARQWAAKDFKPFGYSVSCAIAEAE